MMGDPIAFIFQDIRSRSNAAILPLTPFALPSRCGGYGASSPTLAASPGSASGPSRCRLPARQRRFLPSPRESSRHGEIGCMRRASAPRPRGTRVPRGDRLAVKLIEPPPEAMWPLVPFRYVCPDTTITAMWRWVRLSARHVGFADHAACAAVNGAHFNTASRKRHLGKCLADSLPPLAWRPILAPVTTPFPQSSPAA